MFGNEMSPLLLTAFLTVITLWITSIIWSRVNCLAFSSKPTQQEKEQQAQKRAARAAQSRQEEHKRTTVVWPIQSNKAVTVNRGETTQKTPQSETPREEKQAASRANASLSSKEHTGIRKATLADRVKWDEDRDSQFGGFNIYGHKTNGCRECGGLQVVRVDNIPTFSSFGGIHQVCNMAHLPMADEAMKMLQNLALEFDPILQSRGWTVLALTEMCCCGDGDETLARRTSSTQNHTTLGYCVSTGDGRTALGIHLRLRPSCRPGSPLFPYQQVVDTMAHELAHIAVQNHTPKFHQVMADIARQRLEYMGGGAILDESGFPTGQMGHKLGSTKSEVLGSRELKRKVAESARQRQKERSDDGHQETVATPSFKPLEPTKQSTKISSTDSSKRMVQLRAVEKRLHKAE